MASDVSALFWGDEMLAINARLIKLTDHFRGIIGWADSEAPIFDVEQWPDYPSWAGEYDRKLVQSLVADWLVAVNKLVQDKIGKPLQTDRAMKVVAEDVIAMRPLSNEEQKEIAHQLGEPMELIERRLDNLLALHLLLAKHLPYGESWDSFRRRQEKEVKARFPKALRQDREMLALLVVWRALIHERVVNTRKVEIAEAGVSGKEELLDKFYGMLREVGGS